MMEASSAPDSAGGCADLREIESVSCNLCGSGQARELYRSRDHRFRVDMKEWPVVQCRTCGLAYLNPRPTRDSIGRYYPSEFFGGRAKERQGRRYAIQAEYLRDVPVGRLLDVGCASGDWIKMMSERGWEVSGLEPSQHAANPFALDIRRGGLPEGADWPDESFDAVTAWAVFEHLHDPMAGFLRASSLLKRGGRLVVLVTNIRSLYSRYSYLEDIPRHLFFFSERTLRQYGERCGLRLLEVAHDTRLYGGAGRGTIAVQLWRRLGHSPDEYFRHRRKPLRERIRERPLLGAATVAVSIAERVVLSDRVARLCRVNGHIVATFEKAE